MSFQSFTKEGHICPSSPVRVLNTVSNILFTIVHGKKAHSIGHTLNNILFLIQLYPRATPPPPSLHVALLTYICMVLIFHNTCLKIMHITFCLTWSTIYAAQASTHIVPIQPRYTYIVPCSLSVHSYCPHVSSVQTYILPMLPQCRLILYPCILSVHSYCPHVSSVQTYILPMLTQCILILYPGILSVYLPMQPQCRLILYPCSLSVDSYCTHIASVQTHIVPYSLSVDSYCTHVDSVQTHIVPMQPQCRLILHPCSHSIHSYCTHVSSVQTHISPMQPQYIHILYPCNLGIHSYCTHIVSVYTSVDHFLFDSTPS